MIDNSFRIAALREGVHEKPHPAGDRPLRIAAALALLKWLKTKGAQRLAAL